MKCEKLDDCWRVGRFNWKASIFQALAAVRVLGDITKEKLILLREADDIFIQIAEHQNSMIKSGRRLWFCLPIRSVGVMGDGRTYENAVGAPCRNKCGWNERQIGQKFRTMYLHIFQQELQMKLRGINRVVYDISSKPPATIEWSEEK